MKLKSLLVLLLVSIGSLVSATTSSVDTTLNGLEDKESCYQICGKTYSLHTYPKSQHLNACQRGCRFQILNHLNIAKDSSLIFDPKLVTTKCLNSCSEAYDQTKNSSEYYACSIGCNTTVSTNTTNTYSAVDTDNNPKVQFNDNFAEEDRSDSISDDNNNQLFRSPLQLLRSLFTSLANRGAGGSVVVERHSMSVYLSRNSDGESKLVVIQSEPEVVVHQYPDLMQSNEYDETVTGSEERTDITTDNNRPKLDLSIWTQNNPLEVENPSTHISKSWSNCFTYHSGVPRWVLASVLFLAIIVLAWICCATTATAPEQHIRRKVGQGSDLKYLCLYEEPIKLVIDDKLPTYEELEEQMAQKSSQISSNNSNNDNKESNLK